VAPARRDRIENDERAGIGFRCNATFRAGDHPLDAKFARRTQQEEKHGLLDDTATIGTREGWRARLNATGFALRGHRLVRQGST
jgi:hypothetical protein